MLDSVQWKDELIITPDVQVELFSWKVKEKELWQLTIDEKASNSYLVFNHCLLV